MAEESLTVFSRSVVRVLETFKSGSGMMSFVEAVLMFGPWVVSGLFFGLCALCPNRVQYWNRRAFAMGEWLQLKFEWLQSKLDLPDEGCDTPKGGSAVSGGVHAERCTSSRSSETV